MSADDTRFLAWTAPTIGAADGTEGGRRRARLTLTGSITAAGSSIPVVGGPHVLLPGPADVAAITRSAIRRVRPLPGRADADGEYYPYVDFVDADLPWRYAPEHPGAEDAMGPWLALVAGAEGIDVGIDAAGRAWVSASVTQQLPLANSRLWSHVHERLGTAGWRLEASRLLCPLELRDDADCLAILVPRFRETGGGLADAWQPGQPTLGLPVLHSWRFHTNAAGTFTSLAKALAPIANPPGLGVASVAVDTGAGLERADALGLLGPLAMPDPGGWSDDAAVDQAMTALLASSAPDAGPPRLGPPRYASRWIADVEATAWGRQLNRDPRHRGVAALGTQAGIDWQEQIVEAASRRIGSTHLAAGMLGRLTAGVALAERLQARRPGGAGAAGAEHAADRLAFYGPALRKVRIAGGASALQRLAGETSPLAAGLLSATSLRQLTRGGRRAVAGLPAPASAGDAIVRMNECRRPAEAPLEPAASGEDPGRIQTGTVERLYGELGDEAFTEFGGDPFEVDFSGVRPREPEEERPCEPIPLEETVDRLDAAFDPRGAMVENVVERIRPRPDRFDVPLRIAPDLDLPAWAWLRDRAPQWLLPRSGLIPTDRVVALRTNGAFIEAFLVGLSQQAAAELVWRGVPMSPAAVPMRTLWQRLRDDGDNATIVPDIRAVQDWDPTKPLDDPARHNAAQDDLLVIAMRSDILRRYPETVIRLLPKDAGGDPDPLSPGVSPMAVGMISAGLWCIVFDVAPESVEQWFLVLEETVDGPRFAPRPDDGPQNDLDRPLFGPAPAAETNGAQFAARHWARPVRALIDGKRFADPDGDG